MQLRDEFITIKKQMEQASKWKEAITGQIYDIEHLQNWASKIEIRQEMWKYVEVSTHHIKDWKNQLFSRVRITTFCLCVEYQ